jgi:hypothetical protein
LFAKNVELLREALPRAPQIGMLESTLAGAGRQ